MFNARHHLSLLNIQMGEESPGPEDTSDNAETWRASHPALWTRLKVKVCWEGDKK